LERLDFDPSIDPVAICKTILGQAGQYSANQLRQRHLEDYQAIFNRVGFQLGPDSLNKLPTDTRLAAVKKGRRDNWLIPLYFQYGRYLLMSSSRKPGHLPANLQGIWNKEFNAPWNADFHTNINLQMNYWPAEVANLSETSEILAQFMKQIAVPGAVTAREMYGTKGWTLHHLTDPFGRTGVADGVWGITPMNGPWMCFPLYEHFLFTRDTGYLRAVAYPLLKGSAEFVLGFLSRSPEGYLVTNPSHSPENVFYDQVAKKQSSLTYSATIDVEITQALFDYCREAAEILQTDADFIAQIEAARRQLPPIQVNSKGCIQEWVRDFEEPEPGHRHMSHLLGLYPLTLFTPETPALYAAARNSLERRLSNGGGHTGWSRAWIVNFYARLQDGNKADEHLQALLAKSTESNLFDMHPPFQIDGNFGGTAGIAEMLLQSNQNTIELLPALPAAWPDGEVSGLCARGGFELSMRWKKGRLVEAGITSKAGGEVKLRYHDQIHTIKLASGGSAKLKF
jgi:alpha-L-fucosidase 2